MPKPPRPVGLRSIEPAQKSNKPDYVSAGGLADGASDSDSEADVDAVDIDEPENPVICFSTHESSMTICPSAFNIGKTGKGEVRRKTEESMCGGCGDCEV